jgi:hypothetical protein
MIGNIYGKLAAGSLLLAALSMLVPMTASAQEEERSWTSVRTVQVKASKAREFVELQKQLNEAGKAAGLPSRGVWQEIRGDAGTFHIVGRLDSFAENDEEFDPPMDEEAWTAWVDAISATVSSSTRLILRRHPEYSIPADDDSERALLLLRYTTVAPGKGGDFHDWIGDQLVPALKAGGAKGVTFSHVAFGGDTNLWVSGSRIDNWAALDAPGPLSSMSDEDRAALFANFGDMVWESDVRILRFRPDLSHSGPEE